MLIQPLELPIGTDQPPGGNPCSVCSKRGHPDICFYSDASQSSRPNHGSSVVQQPSPSERTGNGIGASTSLNAVPKTSPSGSAQPVPSPTAVGIMSGATYVQQAISPQAAGDPNDIRSGLGLTNVSTSHTDESSQYGFQSMHVADLCPTRSEILR